MIKWKFRIVFSVVAKKNCNKILFVIFFLLGDSPVYEFYVPTFRNTLSRLHRSCEQEEIKKKKIGFYKFGNVCTVW
jgi:hypothetical protein